MFCFHIITTIGTFQVWDEAVKQLLGITAFLVTLTGGRHILAHIEEQVTEGVWELEVEDSQFSGTKRWKPLIGACRAIDR